MEELNLSYEIKPYKRGPNGLAAPEMKQIHSLGKSPILSISAPNAAKPVVLAESAVIMEYLLDHFGGQKLIPKRYVDGQEGQPGGETESWMRYRYYMHYTEGSLMPLVVTQILMDSKLSSRHSLFHDIWSTFINFDDHSHQKRTGPILRQTHHWPGPEHG